MQLTPVAFLFFCLSVLWLPEGRANDSLAFSGVLLDNPCHLDPASGAQNVEFSDTPVRNFWALPGRGADKTFSIKLINCYASTMGKVLRVTFSGMAEPDLPGALAVTGVNAGRLAVILTEADGFTPLKLGDAHNAGTGTPINTRDVQLSFGAYIQATPSAMAARSVVPGGYNATATFSLSYQ